MSSNVETQITDEEEEEKEEDEEEEESETINSQTHSSNVLPTSSSPPTTTIFYLDGNPASGESIEIRADRSILLIVLGDVKKSGNWISSSCSSNPSWTSCVGARWIGDSKNTHINVSESGLLLVGEKTYVTLQY